MKNTFLREYDYFLRSEKRYWVTYLILLVIFCVYDILTHIAEGDPLFFRAFGIRELFFDHSISASSFMLFLNIGIFLYMGICLLVKDLKTSKDFIFLRVPPHRWLLQKECSKGIYLFFLKLVLYVLVFFLYLVVDKISMREMNLILETFCWDLVFTYWVINLFEFLFFLFCSFPSKRSLAILVLTLSLCCFIGGFMWQENMLWKWSGLLLQSIIFIGGYTTIFTREYSSVFERMK